MVTLLADLRYALRQLRRTPGFTAVALLTLAVGLGVNASMFSVVSAVLFRPIQVEEPERLVRVYTSEWERSGIPSRFFGASSLPDFEDLQAALTGVLSSSTAWVVSSAPVGTGAEATDRITVYVAGDFFAAYAPRMVLGRGLPAAEVMGRDGGRSVVIGDALWQARFDADSGVLGRAIMIADEPFTIVGVASSASLAPMFDQQVELVLPMSAYARVFGSDRTMRARDNRFFHIAGRMRPDVTIGQAQAALTAAGARLSADHRAESGGRAYTLRSARTMIGFAGDNADQMRALAALMLAITGVVLVIVCANVANLLLARASRRAREVAVRLALGAGRGRIVRQLFTESLLLALLGGALATLIALWATDLVRLLPLPAGVLPGVDVRVLGFTLVLAAGSALVFGLTPALHGARLGAAQTIQRAGGTTTTGSRSRLRSALLVAQMALAFVLLVAAGLLGRTLRSMRSADPGFDLQSVLIAQFGFDSRRVDAASARAAYGRVMDRVAAVPGVERLALATRVPMSGGGVRSSVTVSGYEPAPTESMELPFLRVTREYVETMGMRIVAGVSFASVADGAPRVLINQAMARRYWAGRDPLGSTIRYGDGPELVVIGVVADAYFESLTRPPEPMVFQQFGDGDIAWVPALHVRTSGDPSSMAGTVRTLIADLAPELSIGEVRRLDEIAANRAMPSRVAAIAMAIFGALALLLTSIGLYGVMAFLVSLRTPEVGIRMALGADRGAVVSLFLRDGARVALMGIGVGVLLALGVTRVLASALHGVAPWDPVTYAGIALLLAAVAVAASWIPARRASAITPTIALRTEGG